MESTNRIPIEPSCFRDLVDTTKDATANGRQFGVSSDGGTESMGMSFVFLCVLGGSLIIPDQTFFSNRNKSVPSPERTKELLLVLKDSGDEGLRMAAVDELRLVDAQSNPEVIKALVETLGTDRKSGVRAEAAVSLSRMRPIRPEIGQALEQTIAKDSSMRVRMQARSALLQYNLAGYRSVAPAINSPAQLDPLGQIAKETPKDTPAEATQPPSTSPNRIWSWMGIQSNWLGTNSNNETAQNNGTAGNNSTSEPKPWMRPGRTMVGWVQGVFGSTKEPQRDSSAQASAPSATSPVVPTSSGAPGRTVSNPGRGNAPGSTAGGSSLGNAGNPGAIPTFPPIPEFKPGSPSSNAPSPSGVPTPIGPDLGKPDR